MTARGTMQWMTLGAVFSAFLFSIIVGAQVVKAADGVGNAGNKYGLYGVFSDDTQKNRYIAGTQVGSTDSNQLLTTTIGNVINTILTFIGVIFFILMLAAGVLWMTSRGNEEKTTQAVQIIYAAIVGIIIVFGSYALTKFIFRVTGSVDPANICNQTSAACAGLPLGSSCGTGYSCTVFGRSQNNLQCACMLNNNTSAPPVNAPSSNGPAIATCVPNAIAEGCSARLNSTACNAYTLSADMQVCSWDSSNNVCSPKINCTTLSSEDPQVCFTHRDVCDVRYLTGNTSNNGN